MCNLKKLFSKIDKTLIDETSHIINNLSNNLDAGLVFFDTPIKYKDVNKDISIDCDYPGIYIFKLIDDVEIGQFDDVIYGAKTNNNCGDKFFKDYYLYLGKSEEKLEDRLKEHIVACPSKTYSLRLFDEKRNHLYGKVEVYAFKLKTEYNDYKKIILSTIESQLHKMLKPVVGTSR